MLFAEFTEQKLTLKEPRFFVPFSSMEKGRKAWNFFGQMWYLVEEMPGAENLGYPSINSHLRWTGRASPSMYSGRYSVHACIAFAKPLILLGYIGSSAPAKQGRSTKTPVKQAKPSQPHQINHPTVIILIKLITNLYTKMPVRPVYLPRMDLVI